MIGMSKYPDKYFDLAVVDPPYGIGLNEMALGSGRWKDSKKWDDATPTGEYFNELWRVSKNQIVWGMNFLNDYLPKCNMTIVWDKENGNSFGSDYELAWTSFESKRQRIFRQFWISNMIPAEEKPRIHPAQKPIKLYEWLFKNYLPQGGKVIDTHLGSGSNRIAADKAGNIDFFAWELDKDYFEAQEKRFRNYKAQLTLFQAA